MRSVVKWAVHNSPAVNTFMIGLLVVGAVSMVSLRREVFPSFELEIILVTVPYPGASPEEIAEGICQKIEEAVRSVDGIKKQTAVAQENSGFLVLELQSNADVQKILIEVQSEVDRIPSFPILAEDPEIKQITLREPVIRLAVMGPDNTDIESALRLRNLTEKIRSDLLRQPTVSQANISGERDYQIDIEIPEEALRRYGLTLQEVANIVRRENLELPGGRIRTETQEYLLRGKNKRLTGVGIAELPLVTQANGVVLKIGDIGTVSDAFVDDAFVSRVDGKPALVVNVERTKSEDLLAMIEEVKAYVANVEVPAGYRVKTWADRSVDVSDRMNLLIENGVLGLALVFFMLALFLNLRLSFWVALGIPVAVLSAGTVLLYCGETLNMLSMFAFLMALGIVVDDAIVIGENIHAHQQRGIDPVQAAIDGTLEVLPSVAASVATTIVAFMPLLYVTGVMGKFLAVMPLAVIAMLVVSLLESALILPCHLAHTEPGMARRFISRFVRMRPVVYWTMVAITAVVGGLALWRCVPPRSSFDYMLLAMVLIPIGLLQLYPLRYVVRLFNWLSGVTTDRLHWFIDHIYRPILDWCVRRPGIVSCSAVSLLLVSLGFVNAGFVPYIIFPKTDTNEIIAKVSFPDGTPAHITEAATRKIEEGFERLNNRYTESGTPIKRTLRRAVGLVTGSGPLGPATLSSGSHVGMVEVELVETSSRDVLSYDLLSEWREETGPIAGTESLTFELPEMGPGGAAIEFKILSSTGDVAELEAAVEASKAELARQRGVVDVRDDSRPGKWEFQLVKKPKAESMGIPLAQLAETVRASYYGEEVMRLQRGRHEVKLMVRYPSDQRRSLFGFEEIEVRTPDGAEYPLTELADVKVRRGYSEINRIDQLRSITVTADVKQDEGNASQTVNYLQEKFVPTLLADYPGVFVRWEGQKEQTDDSVHSMLTGFGVALLGMYVLLTVEFRSYIQPALILMIIPFGVVGAIWGHAVMGLPITIFTLFGLIALTGVVVNDAIVLIDFINHRRAAGFPMMEALLDAGCRRFRPVLLTSVTTIAGLTPMLMEKSFQAQFLIPLAATMVFGLMLATLMVLILIPTFYGIYWRLFLKDPTLEPETLLIEPPVRADIVHPIAVEAASNIQA